jgi:hypothetical protein
MERLTYAEAAESTDLIPANRARREIIRHQAEWAEFTADLGDHPTYRTCDVLAWLGY